MAQPKETRQARCPKCKRWLYLHLIRPDGQHAQPSELSVLALSIEDLKRPVYRSDDMTSCLLWVETRSVLKDKYPWEEIGSGPDGDAPGQIECDVCGPLDEAALKAHFEKVGF